MANGYVRYHPSSRQREPFERRNLWPQEEEEEVLAGSTYDPALGSGSPINYEALGRWDDPEDSGYDVQVINREDLGLPPLEDERLFGEPLSSRRVKAPSLMDTDFKSKIPMSYDTPAFARSQQFQPVRNRLASSQSIDDIYNAIYKAEHRSTRKRPWIKTQVRGGSAWGEVQITDGTMKTVMNSHLLSPEEFQYARRYVGIPSKDKAKWLTGSYEKKMYRTIAKKLMAYYLELSGGDPRGVMTKWYLGPNAGDVKGDSKSSRVLENVLKRMSGENRRYMEIYMKELGL